MADLTTLTRQKINTYQKITNGGTPTTDLWHDPALSYDIVPIEQVIPDPTQPRRDLGELSDLVESMKMHGVLQPLVVSPCDEGGYLVIHGERRLTAAQRAGLTCVPIIVRTVAEQARLEQQIIENTHRKDLDPVELARAYKRLLEEFGLTQRELANRVQKLESVVSETLSILSLPEEALNAVRQENRTLNVLANAAKLPPLRQASFLARAAQERVTVREAKELREPRSAKSHLSKEGGSAITRRNSQVPMTPPVSIIPMVEKSAEEEYVFETSVGRVSVSLRVKGGHTAVRKALHEVLRETGLGS